MKKIYQTRTGRGGNCFQASIASYLGLGLNDVPDFCNLYRDNWWKEFRAWCGENGMTPIELKLEALDQINKGCTIWLVVRLSNGMRHQVIAVTDGVGGYKIVHDPHQPRLAIKQVEQFGFVIEHVLREGLI